MMSLPFLKAFELHEHLRVKLRYPDFYFRFDRNSSRFSWNDSNTRLLVFNFSFFSSATTILLYLFLYGLWQPGVTTLMNWGFTIFHGIFYCCAVLFASEFLREGRAIVLSANELIRLEELGSSRNCECLTSKKTFKSRGREKRVTKKAYKSMACGTNTVAGFIACGVAVYLTISPFIFTLGYILSFIFIGFRADPLFLTLRSIHPAGENISPVISWLVALLGFPVYHGCVMEGTRTMLHGLIFFIFTVCYLSGVLHSIKEKSKEDVSESLRLYKAVSTFSMIIKGRGLGKLCYLTLQFGYFVLMMVSSCCLAGHELFPLPVFFIAFAVMIIGILILFFILPIATQLPVNSTSMLDEWKGRGETTLLQRKEINALMPVSLHFGSFRKLDPVGRQELLESIIMRTVDANLFFMSYMA